MTMQLTFKLYTLSIAVHVQCIKFKDTYFAIYGIISEFTDKGNFTSLPGQFQYLTLLRGLQGGLTCKFDQVLSTAKNLSIGYFFA